MTDHLGLHNPAARFVFGNPTKSDGGLIAEPPIEELNEIYVSTSSIDKPPQPEPRRKVIYEASDDFKEARASDLWKGERVFEVDVSVTLRPKDGKAIKVPILVNTIRGTMVEELIALAFKDERTMRIVRAVLDNPRDRVRAEPTDESDEPQEELPF
jgi:hypothetical protein